MSTPRPVSAADPSTALQAHGLASATLTARWSDAHAVHEERLHVERFSLWREADLLPPELGAALTGLRAGARIETRLAAGAWLPRWEPTLRVDARRTDFDRHHRPGLVLEPRLGRFYPQGFVHGVHGIFPEATQPLRILDLTEHALVLDLNHPLARFPLQLAVQVDAVLPGSDRRGGRCVGSLDDLLQYPGLAAPLTDGRDTDFGERTDGLARADERPDAQFYARPRMAQHLDRQALGTINALHRRLIGRDGRVLDLMASFDSHLQGVAPGHLTVLGMNDEELAANADAHERIVHDLNAAPTLPLERALVDAVTCTASIEYLTRPGEVLNELRRVLRPGGALIITFSNRWFPPKAIRLWSELHEFERVGMITQWLHQAGFHDLHTLSARGGPRPADDVHAHETPHADPVYAVWGYAPE